MQTLIYRRFPPLNVLLQDATHYPHLAVCLEHSEFPELPRPQAGNAAEAELYQRLQAQLACLQWHGANLFDHLLPNAQLWLMPPAILDSLHDYFGDQLQWRGEPIAQKNSEAVKPWFIPPPSTPVEQVAVIGAGIAGATTARALAERGVAVTVLEAGEPAGRASGNRQGLLYAKISAHATAQTELLLCGYGYSKRLLERLLPDSEYWGASGVLHLDHDAAEAERNRALGQMQAYRHLFHHLDAEAASALAGIELSQSGLYWPQGVWLNPAAWVHALLDHPAITVLNHHPLQHASHDGQRWQLTTPQQRLSASHLVYCTGADSRHQALLSPLPLHSIRGQTSLAAANTYSEQLHTALSGASYLAPAWQGIHTYGATFIAHDADSDWRETDEQANRQELAALHSELAESLSENPENLRGHAAIRCDSPDHLPLVGPLGDIAAMQAVYAKLALDRKYRLTAPCPYQPNVYLNTAHGSRGLATAPLCAEAIAADLLGQPNPLSRALRAALHPNRYIVRAIGRQQPLL